MKGILSGLLVMMAVLFIVSCGDDGTETPDTDTVINDTVTNDSTIPDTEQPDADTGGNTGTPGEMVEVPAGEFWMGCNEAVDDQCEGDESPYHAVTLSAYKIGKYEVTVGEYQQCVTNGTCNNSNENEPHYYTNTDIPYCNLGAPDRDNHPMNCLSWYGAKAYCEWIGGRLPTEAEWEKAARGTDGRKYPWGDTPAVSCDYAVMDDDDAGGEGCGTDGTMPVGSKPNGVSPYGAHDMIGNVWEWVNDRYDEDYYTSSPTNNPTGPETGDGRVMRGGSWRHDLVIYLIYLRASSRVDVGEGSIADYFGFRCAK
ncbi:MAG TPA: formylglycine-generating enzyme family protein [bacterium]|nr:formylglycine-generating enzyme family protein [bacterium]